MLTINKTAGMTAKTTGLACIFGIAIASSLQATGATRFSADLQPLASVAPLVLSNTDISDGSSKAYRPWFENGSWQGDIIEYSVSAGGRLSTSVVLTGPTPINPDASPANWSALVAFANNETADYWDTGREIITWNGSGQKAFRWTSSTIGTANMALIDPAAADASASKSDILNFIRGDRSNEFPAPIALRARISVMGDVIHSNPVYVAAPNGNRTDKGYAIWAAGKLSRSPRVYVGANDGMLHAFDAANGNEVYAYVPSMLMGNLNKLVARPYEHTYFVDGKLTVRDAYFNNDWHSVLVGTLGAGGRGFFALDITDPDLTDEAAASGTDIKVLWEVDASADADLGDSFSRAVIAQLNDGKWYAVVGNGYNSVNGVAMLYIIDIETGAITKKVSTGDGSPGSPNGLSTPGLLDTNKDGKADYAYAGDIDGNLWKFDLSSTNSSGWVEDYGRPLHPGVSGQAITMGPQIVAHPSRGFIIMFATGSLYTTDAASDPSTQAMYGIWDSGDTPPSKDDQSLLAQNWDGKTYTSGAISESVTVYNPDAGDVDWDTQHGWKGEFPAGFRVLEGVQVRAARVKATVHNPITNENYIIEAAVFDGGPHPTPIYDLNVDGLLTSADLVDGNSDSDLLDTEDVPMAWKKPGGIMSQVTIARVGNGVDTLFLNYLQPPVPEPCEGVCEGGFQGGHIDVDTYHNSNGLGSKSTKHDHEYDKKTGQVFVDLFDVNVPNSGGEPKPRKDITGHVEINSAGSGIASNEPFVLLIANADFSPGSTLRIGNKSWNVVEYQRQIHTALKNWDATDPSNVPEDADGDSMIFTWGGIEALNGSISHNFDNLAILAGGLHPTQTGCVKDSAYDTYNSGTKVGRWRNGSLTTQLVKASYFSSSSAITQVDVQEPTDLVEVVTIADGTTIKLTEDYDGDSILETANHEYIGGLLAKSGSEHIYESTLFWHFGSLSSLLLGVKPCYGDADWPAAVALEQSNDSLSAALDLLGIEDLDAELAANVYCADKKVGGNGQCKNYYKLLEKLVKLRDENPGTTGTIDTGLGGSSGAPIIMGGGAENQGVTAGPQFEYGRMTWTDIVPN